MMTDMLANAAAGADPMISGEWIIKIIGAIFTGAALILGRYWGRKEKESESSVTIKKPVPTILTRSEDPFATQPDLEDHVKWCREEFQRVWGQFGVERKMHNDELTQIHERINIQANVTATIKGSVEEIGKNVSQLLALALGKNNPPTGRR
jgi:hypothetical protein